ncbi:MAG TPA: sugar transferase [Ktedonobacteraceae bacterium]|nr:sugar transferase [Ktedonobacteraceae bacterium]
MDVQIAPIRGFNDQEDRGAAATIALVDAQIAPVLDFNLRYLQIKRVLDVLFSLLVLIPLSIVTVIIAILIRLDSAGPIFYRHKRVGLNGVEFYMLKFRSMYANCDDSSHREAAAKYMSGQSLSENATDDLLYKQADDPRITRVGRFLRKMSIDELPQFFNVLRGEMTLVGPRPPLPYEVELYTSYDRLRLFGKPGLTGPWQVYGRSRVPFQTMVEMDIAYLQRQSLREDLKLIALTVPVMLLGRGGA